MKGSTNSWPSPAAYDAAGAAGRSFMSGVITGFNTRRAPSLTMKMEAATALSENIPTADSP
jgi:hypothetical protein